MSQVLLDTNVLIYHLDGTQPLSLPPFGTVISVLTVFELLRYPGLSLLEERRIRDLLDAFLVIPVTHEIAERAALLGRTHRVGAIDLLLAATALEYRLPFITKNAKDFKKMGGLELRASV